MMKKQKSAIPATERDWQAYSAELESKNQRLQAELRQVYEAACQAQDIQKYVLRLFIIGNTPKSTNALLNLRELCEQELPGRYDLEVIDIRQQPGKARGDQIVATPTLIKTLPTPIRKIIGDLSKKDKILVGLGLVKVEK